jgi:DNA-binding transcriptional LysR family regulator
MQIEALKIFCDVAKYRSFSRCAEAHGISQSAASQAVHGLEETLGVALIDRSQRPWQLTEEGRIFSDGCRDLLRQYAELEEKVKGSRAATEAEVRVSSIYSAGLRHMRHYVERFAELEPGVKVHLEYQHPDEVYESVLGGQADLGVVSFPQARRELTVIPWKSEPMALVCPPDHPLAQLREVSPAQLGGQNFVNFDRGLGIRQEIDRFLKKHGVEVTETLEFDNIEAIKRAVEIGSGLAILPRPTLDSESEAGTLVAVPFKGAGFSRPLAIVHRRGKRFGPAVERFIDLMRRERDPRLAAAR